MRRFDVALAALLAAYAVAQVLVLDGVGGPAWVSAPCLVVAAAALALRRTFPLITIAVVAAGVSAQALLTQEAPEGLVVSGPLLIATYSVAAYGTGRRQIAGLAIAALALAAHTIGDPLIRTAADVEDASFWWLALVAGWLVGLAVHRHRQARELRDVAAELERERDEAAARERTRMARELHDVVSHGVSVIALQAGAAQETLDGDPVRTRERLAAIEETARHSATELRRMLGVLREDETVPDAPREPLPGLSDLPALAASLSAAGLPVSLHIDPAAHAVAASIQLSAYRVVQEGLTNAVKHAGASHVRVIVRCDGEGLDVDVRDDGIGASGASGASGGYGLAGLRERVALHGGRLESGPAENGGFVLRARLQVRPS